jgi:RHS repeat-associated protein
LGIGPAEANQWKTSYEYGELDANGNLDAAKNTGNIARQTLTIPGTSFVQSYKYDSLYRLTEAKEATGANQNWIQNWGYDRYGNRIGFTQNIAGNTNATNPTIEENTNRFTANQGFEYDKNGNVVSDIDPISTLPRTFIFNGDNKQSEVKKDGVTIGRYYYDGEGKRIKKITDTETTVFVYSSGKLIAEYSTQVSQTPSVAYTTTDHLGTPRVITNELGQIKARRDFMPFGEELYTGIGDRSTSLNYGTSQDDIRQKFTGYQKDNETNLDFAEARMYANDFGRFTAVDPLLASGKSANPQTFNRYAYVGSNPLTRKDPDGLDWWYLKGNGVYEPVWYDRDPGEKYERWTKIFSYIYKNTAGEHRGKWTVLFGDGKYTLADTKAKAERLFNGSSDGLTGAQRDFMNGFSNGINPFGAIFEFLSEASGKIDTSSRDYKAGELAGTALGILLPSGAASKIILKGGRYTVEGGTVGFKSLSRAKELVSRWAPDPVRGTIAQNIKNHALKHGAKVGKADDVVAYLNKAEHFFKNRRKFGKMIGEVEGRTDGVVRWELVRDGKTYFMDLTRDNKIVSFGLR